MLLSEAIEEFEWELQTRHYKKETIKNYIRCMNYLLNYVTDIEVEQLTTKSIREFLKEKLTAGRSAVYINDILKVFKVFLNYLFEEELISEVPLIKNFREVKRVIIPFKEEDVRFMYRYYSKRDFISVRNKTIIVMLFSTGIRCNELITMTIPQIKETHIVIKGKGDKERLVPIADTLHLALQRYYRARNSYFLNCQVSNIVFLSRRGRALNNEMINLILKAAAPSDCKARVSPHTCRHTYAQLSIKAGMDIYTLSRLLGHTNVAITNTYLRGMPD